MSLSIPWAAPGDRQYSAPGSLLLRLRLGEAPEDTPALLDVNQRARPPATRLDGGAIDRIVGTLAGGLRLARLHSASANAMTPGERYTGYDEVEQITGVARTFLLRVPPGTPIGRLCDKLSQVSAVEAASPNYITAIPFDLQPGITDTSGDAAWAPRLMVRMAEALAYQPGDPSVLLGLIDSGIANNHAEFLGVFRAGYDTVRLRSHDIAPGIKLLGDHERDDADPTGRFVGHGMACAGIIAAAGIRMPAGLGGAVRIIPMRAPR